MFTIIRTEIGIRDGKFSHHIDYIEYMNNDYVETRNKLKAYANNFELCLTTYKRFSESDSCIAFRQEWVATDLNKYTSTHEDIIKFTIHEF